MGLARVAWLCAVFWHLKNCHTKCAASSLHRPGHSLLWPVQLTPMLFFYSGQSYSGQSDQSCLGQIGRTQSYLGQAGLGPGQFRPGRPGPSLGKAQSRFGQPPVVGGPEGRSPEGWRPEGWEPQNFVLFFPSRHCFPFFLPLLGVFSWIFGGVWCAGTIKCAHLGSGCHVKIASPSTVVMASGKLVRISTLSERETAPPKKTTNFNN